MASPVARRGGHAWAARARRPVTAGPGVLGHSFRRGLLPVTHHGQARQRWSTVGHRRSAGCIRSFLVPDISANPGDPPHIVEMAQKAAASMTSSDVLGRAALEIAATILGTILITKVFFFFEDRATKAIDKADHRGVGIPRLVADSGIAAAARPAKLITPWVAVTHSLRTVMLASQILLDRNHVPSIRHIVSWSFFVLTKLDSLLLEASQLAVIAFTTWFLLEWKEKLVAFVVQNEEKKKEKSAAGTSTAAGIERMVLPFSSLAGWGMVAVAGLEVAHVLGLNLQPLLTVGGVGGLALGFGAQAVTSNAISGINLFLTRPFVVGERVELKTASGGSVLVGTVEKIEVMRTVIRTDKMVPVAIPNRAINDMIVANESRIALSLVQANFTDPRQFATKLALRYDDLEKVPAIIKDIKKYFVEHPGVNRSLPYGATLDGFSAWSVDLHLLAHTTSAKSREYIEFEDEVLMALYKIVDKNGARFAFPTTTVHHSPQLGSNFNVSADMSASKAAAAAALTS